MKYCKKKIENSALGKESQSSTTEKHNNISLIIIYQWGKRKGNKTWVANIETQWIMVCSFSGILWSLWKDYLQCGLCEKVKQKIYMQCKQAKCARMSALIDQKLHHHNNS